jgi:hypothetical protein
MVTMTYTITWTGVAGPTRTTGLTTAQVVQFHKSYGPISPNFLIWDDQGSPICLEVIVKLLEGNDRSEQPS